MKLLNEIIAELIIEPEEVIQDLPDDGTTSFFDEDDPTQLCDECKAVGFCRNFHPEEFRAKLKDLEKAFRMPEEEIKNMVPLKENNVTWELFGKGRTKHLQIAHDAFHQDDFETAVLNYESILQEYSYDETAHIYLGVCYYLLGNYDKAIDHASRINRSYSNISNFILHFQNVMNDRNKIEAEIEEYRFENV